MWYNFGNPPDIPRNSGLLGEMDRAYNPTAGNKRSRTIRARDEKSKDSHSSDDHFSAEDNTAVVKH